MRYRKVIKKLTAVRRDLEHSILTVHDGYVQRRRSVALFVDHVGIRLREFKETIDEIEAGEIGGRVERSVARPSRQVHVRHTLRGQLRGINGFETD